MSSKWRFCHLCHTPRCTSVDLAAHDSPNRERTTNVEGGKIKLQDITCHNHLSARNKNAETQTSIQKIYITFEIHSKVSLQGKFFQKCNKVYIVYSKSEIHQKSPKYSISLSKMFSKHIPNILQTITSNVSTCLPLLGLLNLSFNLHI